MDHHVAGISCADPEGGQDSPSLKNHKNTGFFLQYWCGSNEKSQSYQTSIQRGTCFQGLFWSPLQPKLKIAFYKFLSNGLLDD